MIRLEAGELACELHPELGGCVAGLWFRGLPVLRSTPARELTSVRQAGSYPLVPFSNRIGEATLVWQGTRHPLVRNNAPEPHAIHGVGWQRPWQVLEQDATNAMLAYEHRADSGWPFDFDSSQTLRLTATSLEFTLSLTNQSASPAPAGLGWHPFFVKRPHSHIAFGAAGRWEMGDDKLPTGRRASAGIDADCALLEVDHCYDGWSGVVHLRDEALHTQIRSNLGWLVVFTNPSRDTIAIEPVSHVNNALSLVHAGSDPAALGLVTLPAGGSLTAQMTIEVRPAP